VLLDRFRPLALKKKWLWASTDLSESATVSEDAIAMRLLTDLAVAISGVKIAQEFKPIGFTSESELAETNISFDFLANIYKNTPGLVVDKLKAVLEFAWESMNPEGHSGIVFAYDEAQTMSDHAVKEEYPLALLLDLFQSIQRKNIPFMLVLVGLPTLFPKLVESRTFSERMFHVIILERLSDEESRAAIEEPTKDCPIPFTAESIPLIIFTSGGYPYFIQFICREIYDLFLHKIDQNERPSVPMVDIVRKLDAEFFSGRWSRITDRQKDLMSVIASLDHCDTEFTVQEIVTEAKSLASPFSASHVNQMLATLINRGLVYKNRYGKYSFAVPLLGQFIRRQMEREIML